jgi:hypothetical protein
LRATPIDAGRGLNAGDFECAHQLLETLPFDTSQEAFGRNHEVLECNVVFAHAPVSEHLDIAAADTLGGEGVGFRAPLLGRQEQAQPLIAGAFGIGAREYRHQVRACRVRDPCLGPVDVPGSVALPGCAGAQSTEVGANVRLGEDGRGEDLAGSDSWQPGILLFGRARQRDQFGSDFGTGSE